MNWRRHFLRLLYISVVTALTIPLVARLRWGYWTEPPGVETLFEDVVSIERFTALFASKIDSQMLAANQAVPAPYFRETDHALFGVAGVERDAWTVKQVLGCSPCGRFTQALKDRSLLPSSESAIEPSRIQAAREELLRHDLWRGGLTCFAYPPAPYAEFAEGTTGTGDRVLLTAFPEPQLSNDHFPYTEARLRERADGGYELESVTRFYFDHAGLEGIAHWYYGIGLGLIALFIWSIATLEGIVHAVADRLSSRAASSPPGP